jgi:hypothetical protein
MGFSAKGWDTKSRTLYLVHADKRLVDADARWR